MDTARRILEKLAMDSERVLGPDDKRTLGVRYGIAEMTGLAGDRAAAAYQYEVLASDYSRLFGEDDDMTLNSRDQAAFWAGEAGDPSHAVPLYWTLSQEMTEEFHNPVEEIFNLR